MIAATRGDLLRFSFQLDAVVSGASGALLLVLAPFAVEVLGTPTPLLSAVGGVSIAYAGGLWLALGDGRVSRAAAWTAISLNVAWVSGSVLLLVAGWLPLTGLGSAVVLLQAIVVAALAQLQWEGLRRSAI